MRLFSLLPLLLLPACSGAESETETDPDPMYAGLGGAPLLPQSDQDDQVMEPGSACDTDVPFDCKVNWTLANGVHSCFVGKQYCDDGFWSQCM